MQMLGMVCSVGSIVCWVMVLMKMFPAEGTLKGILAIICGLYAFVWGWMNAAKFGLKNVMMAWTVLVLLTFVVTGMAFATMFRS